MDIEQLPESLVPLRPVIERTARPMARLVASPVAPGVLSPWASKLGGVPYLPLDAPIEWFHRAHPREVNPTPWPKSRPDRRGRGGGEELQLLVQIDLAEVPPMAPFPTEGILQVFIEDWCGETLPDGGHSLDESIRVLYHRTVARDPSQVWQDFGVLPYAREPHLGLQPRSSRAPWPEHAVSFEADVDYLSRSDFRADSTPGYAEVFTPEYYGFRRPPGGTRDQLGGYHDSSNDMDPRRGRPGWEDSVLLLQLDGVTGVYSWGDAGSARIFIRVADLAAHDFSRVLCHWDST